MKIKKWKISLFLILLLSSCASYKPSIYDQKQNVFINYKHNYQLRLPDGYKKLSEIEVNKIAKSVPYLGIDKDCAAFGNSSSGSKLFVWGLTKTYRVSEGFKQKFLKEFSKRLPQMYKRRSECKFDDKDIRIEEDFIVSELVCSSSTDKILMKNISLITVKPGVKGSDISRPFMIVGLVEFGDKNDKLKEDMDLVRSNIEFAKFVEEERKEL